MVNNSGADTPVTSGETEARNSPQRPDNPYDLVRRLRLQAEAFERAAQEAAMANFGAQSVAMVTERARLFEEAARRIAELEAAAMLAAPMDDTTRGYYERQIDCDAVDPISKRLGLEPKT